MRNNEKGFTYPLTLSIIIIFLFFFSIRVEQLLSERKMANETKKILQQEYYMITSAQKIVKILQKEGKIEPKGIFNYNHGKLNYTTNMPANELQEISLTLQLDTGEISNGIGYFDIRLKKMVKWIEKVK